MLIASAPTLLVTVETLHLELLVLVTEFSLTFVLLLSARNVQLHVLDLVTVESITSLGGEHV